MALLKINGVDVVPTPSDLNVGIQDGGKWERNANWTMIGEIIATKAKLDITWSYITPAQLSTLLTAMNTTFFTVTYTDPTTNALRTMTAYKGDRTVGVLDFVGGVMRYKDFKVNFIER